MMTEVYLRTTNLKANHWGDPVWIAEIRRGEEKNQLSSASLSTHMRLLPLALLDALHHIQQHYPEDPVVIHCENEYVVLGMVCWRFMWARNGWRRADGKPLEHQDLWRQIHESAQSLTLLFADAYRYEKRALTSSPVTKQRYLVHDAQLKELQVGPYSPLF